MDLIVAILCDLQKPVMSTHNATSWGYFDPIGHSWNQCMSALSLNQSFVTISKFIFSFKT